MDSYLRLLRTKALKDPAAKDAYIAALERALMGEPALEHPLIEAAPIAQSYVALSGVEAELLDGLIMNNMGVMIETDWRSTYEVTGEEWEKEEMDNIISQCSPEVIEAIDAAGRAGFSEIIFWF